MTFKYTDNGRIVVHVQNVQADAVLSLVSEVKLILGGSGGYTLESRCQYR